MPEENRFFRWVWRFNAVVIALAVLGLLGIAAASFVVGYLHPWQNEKPEGHFTPVQNAAEAHNTYRLRSTGTIAFLKAGGGQEVDLVFSLGNWEGSPNEYGLQHINRSGSYREPYNANVLLVSTNAGEGHWLFSGIGRNILSWDAVVDPTAKDAPEIASVEPQVVSARGLNGGFSAAKALVLKVVDKDTDKDGELTAKDGLSLYTWRLGEKTPVKLLDADLVTSQTQIGADRYAISYESKGAAFLAVYSVPDFKLVIKKSLPKLPG
jgi:hypothetical protein